MTNTVKPMRNVIPALTLALTVLLTPTEALSESGTSASDADLPKVRVVTSEGAFELQLRPDVAPETVSNFLEYVRSDFYDGTVFHRVIPGFMIQGGGFSPELSRKSTRAAIANEASQTLPNLRGTISMARTSAPDSATSQFFINLVDNGFLNKGVRGAGYAVFGKVTGGMGVVDSIANSKTGYSGGMADVPVEPIMIQSVSILETTE
ncbi:peptidylprolyl isomerase [Marinobacter sediminum]|nr:peptidylprolyl isomerase [Marinobacter sediminum]MCM0612221.1 peptidylprolyl isomerase [Marinobacter sediminum]